MKIHKPQKRTIQIRKHRYFLDFPEILENNNEYAIRLDGKLYHLPLPNIFTNNSVCNGDAGPDHFWTSEFTKIYLPIPWDYDQENDHRYKFYDTWQKQGFDSIKKEIPELPFYAAINYIDNPTQKQKITAINESYAAIKYFPNDVELQKLAVRQSFEAIIYIKQENVIEEEVVLEHLNLHKTLKYVPGNSMTYSVKEHALNIDPDNIYYMAGPNLEKELALMAVRKNGLVYRHLTYCDLPYSYRKEVQQEAIKNNPLAAQYIHNQI